MTVKRIAILGTAADPVTIGHLEIMKQARDYFDEVWIMPTYKHKFGKATQASSHRLHMCELAVQEIGSWAKVSDFEIKHQLHGATIQTIRLLKEKNPEFDFFWLIGMDNVQQIHKWEGFPGLLNEVKFVVFDRAGYEVSPGWWQQPPHLYLPGSTMDVSSTSFRNLYRNGEVAAKQVVPPSVYSYIQDKHLYRGD